MLSNFRYKKKEKKQIDSGIAYLYNFLENKEIPIKMLHFSLFEFI